MMEMMEMLETLEQPATLTIQLNGEPYEVAAETTVTDLIAGLQLAEGRIALELNLEILPRAKWNETRLRAGDKLELVHFVGGG